MYSTDWRKKSLILSLIMAGLLLLSSFPRGFTALAQSNSATTICVSPLQDAYVIQDRPTENHGGENDLKVKPDAGKERRILIGFDLSSIPPTSTILDATLRLYEDSKHDGQTVSLQRLTNSWAESQVTWNNRITGTPWATPGGDFDATPLATFSPDIDKLYREIDVTDVTQGWVNGSYNNYGFLLLSSGVNGEVKFKSREESNADKNPQLCITYQELPTNQPPRVAISAPAAGSTFVSGNRVSFSGAAKDIEDGDLTARISWESSINGIIGTGASFTRSDLSVGVHTITASVTDSGGLTASASTTITVTSLPQDVIFADGFESGDLSAWSSSSIGGGDLSVSTAAALVDNYGLQALVNDIANIYVRDDSPNAEPRYRARFYFDPNSISMADGDDHYILVATSGATSVLRVQLRFSGGNYQIRASHLLDGGTTFNYTNWISISDALHFIELDWRAATAAGANDGSLTLWIDGVQKANLTGADNDTWRIDYVRLGMVTGRDPFTLGTYYFDAFESRQQSYIGPVLSGTNHFPLVTISTPADGATFNEGNTVNFNGTASDIEDGDLTAGITWESDNTIIGTGASFSWSDLSIGVHTVTASVMDSGGQTSIASTTFTVFADTAILVGAGDIADDREYDEATAELLETIPGTVITLGDNAYPSGTEAEYNNYYEPTWGRHKARTMPAAGNHEYDTGTAEAYFNYFGAVAGDADKGYYSYNVGDWHIITLNTECSEVGGCGSNDPQGLWLQADLAANPSICTLAVLHKPLFSSGSRSSDGQDYWSILYQAGADVILSGHAHLYERFALQDPNGVADPVHGIREFVVGTGGGDLHSPQPLAPNTEARSNTTFGVIKLTLHQTSYDWDFIPIAGQTFTDSGSAQCVSP